MKVVLKLSENLFRERQRFILFIILCVITSSLEIYLVLLISDIMANTLEIFYYQLIVPVVFLIFTIAMYETLYNHARSASVYEHKLIWNLSRTTYLDKNISWQITDITKFITNYTGRNYASVYVPSLLVINKVIFLIALSIYMVALHGAPAFLILPVSMLFVFLLFIGLQSYIQRWGFEMTDAISARIEIINSYFGSFKENYVHGASGINSETFDSTIDKLTFNQKRLSATPIHIRSSIDFMLYCTVLVIAWVGNVQSEVLFATAFLLLRALPSAQVILSGLNQINSNKAKFLYFWDTVGIMKARKVGANIPLVFQSESGDFSIPEISFTLLGRKYEFSGLKFHQSNMVLLTGDSGEGKSTFLDALAGLAGVMGGSNIKTQNIDTLTPAKISYCAQEIQVSHGSIFQNLSVQDKIEFDQICGPIARSLGIYDVLIELHNQNRLFEIDNKLLSGGQLKRFGILRCLSREADVYLFDEPEAGLDGDNIERFYNLIRKLGKTCIIASHSSNYTNEFSEVINIIGGQAFLQRCN